MAKKLIKRDILFRDRFTHGIAKEKVKAMGGDRDDDEAVLLEYIKLGGPYLIHIDEPKPKKKRKRKAKKKK